MPASTDPAPAFSPRHGGDRQRRHGYLPWNARLKRAQPTATVLACFRAFCSDAICR